MTPLTFEPVELNKQSNYLNYLNECPLKASDYSFVNLWSWADTYGLVWAWSRELVWIKQTRPREAFWAPVGRWDQIDWKEYADDCFEQNLPFVRVPEMLVALWQESFVDDRVSAETTREHWDYVYSVPELSTLTGNRFHKKKNLINQFKKKYEFEYLPLSDEMIDLAAGMQENWCTWRDCESNEALDAENAAISKVLQHWRQLQRMTGGAIMVDSKLAAYTVAERFTEDTLLIHFEKGEPSYKGVYQAINQMFLKNAGNDFKFVNREQDLGDEGLRRAKLSYHPTQFLKKYRVTVGH